jgi:ABC-type multidrug transport system fused ATPase/permease subunit
MASPTPRGGIELLWALVLRYPRLLALIGFLAFLGPLVTAPTPYLGKIIIDDIIFRQMSAVGRTEVTAFLGVSTSIWMLAGIVGLGVCLKLIGSLIGGWQSHYILQITRNGLHETRLDTAERVMGAPQRFFETSNPGRITSRLTSDSGQIDGAVFTILRQFFNAAFTVLIVMVFMLAMNPWLTFIVLATIPATAFLSMISFRKLRDFSREESDRWANLSAVSTEIFSSVKIIRAFCAEAPFLARLRDRSEAIRYEGIHHWTTMHTVNGLLSLLSSLGADIFLFVGGVLAIQGKITFGEFFAFSAYQGMLWGPINVLLTTGQTIQVGTASADKVHEMLQLDQEPYLERPPGLLAQPFIGEVKAEAMGFSYDGQEDVLREITLHLKPGTMTALVGQSGSGKTTFASLLLGLYLPTKGKLLIDGTDVRQWDLRQLRSRIGVVLQESVLFDDTVRGNLCMGNTHFTDEQLWAALRSSRIEEPIRALPEGLDTPVGANGTRLSGGQRQRIAIARVFLRDPRLLILDEATSALDSETEKAIQQSFDALMVGRTSVVIAHRLSTIFRADQIVVLHQGRVIEVGTHEELVEREDGHYRKLFLAQVEGMVPMSGPTRKPWSKT